MMSATEMVARALECEPHCGDLADCGFCGTTTTCRPAEDVLKVGWTRWDTLRSHHICWACEACFAARQTRSSFLCAGGEFRRLMRKDIWPAWLSPPEPPFVIYATSSGQKHGLYLMQPATSRARHRTQCEDLSADFDVQTCRTWMEIAARLVLDGAKRSSVESGSYVPADYRRLGIKRITTDELELSRVRGSTLWKIVVGMMPGKADLEEAIS